MNLADLKKELLNYKPISFVGCSYCHANPKKPSWEEFREVLQCNNCRCDIKIKGQWTGYGWQYLSELYKKFPKDERWKRVLMDLFGKDKT